MRNEYKVTKDLMKSWARDYYKNGGSYTVRLIVLILVAICEVECAVYFLRFPIYHIFSLAAIGIFVFALYCIFLQPTVNYSKSYKMHSKIYGVSEWIRSTDFGDDEITVTDHSSVYKYRYVDIKRIKETDDGAIIFFKFNLAIRLYKDAFACGSWEECKKLIAEKRRKPLQM